MDTFDVLKIAVDAGSRSSTVAVGDVERLAPADVLQTISLDLKRASQMFDDALCSVNPSASLWVLLKFGVLGAVSPEIDKMRYMGDWSGMHKDVWRHTCEVVSSIDPDPTLRWSAFLHDVGKTATRRVEEGGRVTFHGHDVVGARIFDRMSDRTKLFSVDFRRAETVRSMILNHLRPHSYSASWTDSAVRRLVCEVGGREKFDALMKLAKADLTTKNDRKRMRAEKNRAALQARVEQIIAEDARLKLPKGLMGEILATSGEKPGRWLNELRDKLEVMLNDGQIDSDISFNEFVKLGLKLR